MQVLGTPHWAPAIVWNCHKRATREGVHVIFCISFTQYYCCRMCFTKEQFHYQKTEDLAPGTWEFEFSRKAALTYLPWQCKFHNQETGEQNHFTAGGVFLTPQWYTEGLWPDTTKHLEAVLGFKHASSSVAPVESLACLTASTGLNVWLKQDLD